MPFARYLKSCDICGNVLKLNLSEWPFIVGRLRHTCALIVVSNQPLDMAHLGGLSQQNRNARYQRLGLVCNYLREMVILCVEKVLDF